MRHDVKRLQQEEPAEPGQPQSPDHVAHMSRRHQPRQPQRQRRPFGDPRGKFEGLFHQLRVRHHAAYQVGAFRFRRVHHAPGQHHLHRLRLADEARAELLEHRRRLAGDARADLCTPLGSCEHAFTMPPPLSFFDGQPQFGLWEIGMFLGFGGLFLFTMTQFMSKNNIVAIKDPRMHEALKHHVTY